MELLERIGKKELVLLVWPIFGIGFLRLILALAVVFDHSAQIPFFGFINGTLAVRSFFIISGFYMALILTEKYKTYSTFIRSRFLRIFPLYFVVLAITLAATITFHLFFLGDSAHKSFYFEYWGVFNPIAIFLLFFSNISLFGQDVLSFIGMNISTGLLSFTTHFNNTTVSLATGLLVPQAWTLSLEIMFYLMAPFLVKQKNKVIFSLIALSLLLRIFLHYKFGVDTWTYRFLPTEIIFFLAGILCYRAYQVLKNITINKKFIIFSQALLFLYLIFYNNIYGSDFIKEGIFFLMIIVNVPLLFLLSKESVWDRYIGELSYPIYLCHVLIFQIVLVLGVPHPWYGLATAIISTLLSIVLYWFIVMPMDVYRHKGQSPVNIR